MRILPRVLLLFLVFCGQNLFAQQERAVLIFSNTTNDWTFVGGKGTDAGFVNGNDNLRIVANNGKAWWSMTYEIDLPSDATDVGLFVQYFAADDRAEMFINSLSTGVGTGIGAPGQGMFRLNPGDTKDIAWDFDLGNGEQDTVITKGFRAGRTNLITLAVNNTNTGIGGATVAVGPSHVSFASTLFYSTNAPVPEVPEPGVLAMWIGGVVTLVVAHHRRRRKA